MHLRMKCKKRLYPVVTKHRPTAPVRTDPSWHFPRLRAEPMAIEDQAICSLSGGLNECRAWKNLFRRGSFFLAGRVKRDRIQHPIAGDSTIWTGNGKSHITSFRVHFGNVDTPASVLPRLQNLAIPNSGLIGRHQRLFGV